MVILINKIIEADEDSQEELRKGSQKIFHINYNNLVINIVENKNNPIELLNNVWYNQSIFNNNYRDKRRQLSDNEFDYINLIIKCVEKLNYSRTTDNGNRCIAQFIKSIIAIAEETQVYQLLVNVTSLTIRLNNEDLNNLLNETQKHNVVLVSFWKMCHVQRKQFTQMDERETDQSNCLWIDWFCGCNG